MDCLRNCNGEGNNVSEGIVHRPWGNRDFRVVDPAGNSLKFTEPAAGRE